MSMEKILLAVLSALLGFMLSQTFNLVSYLRRPKFRVGHWTDGVLGSYTGDPPETPWEIELGFHLENFGKNPAKNTRIFVSDIQTADRSDTSLQPTSIELLELKRPIDLLPSKEPVSIYLGVIKSSMCDLDLNLQSPLNDEQLGMISADTRGKTRFVAKFHISCDDKNSFHSFSLDFCPDKNDWASSLLDDYTIDHLNSVTRPKEWR